MAQRGKVRLATVGAVCLVTIAACTNAGLASVEGDISAAPPSEETIPSSKVVTTADSTVTLASAESPEPNRLLNGIVMDCPTHRLLFKGSTGTSSYDLQVGYYVACGDASAYYQLAENIGKQPAVSADGKLIAFANGKNIRIIDFYGKQLDELDFENAVYSPTWSPDGKYIAYITDKSQVEVVNLAAGTISPVLLSEEFQHPKLVGPGAPPVFTDIVWSPQGREIALYTNYQWTYILGISCDDANSTCVNAGLRSDFMRGRSRPGWSLDGVLLVQVCFMDTDLEVSPQDLLCIENLDGGVTRSFTEQDLGIDLRPISNPSWSPDGSRIAISDGYEIFLISLEDQEVRNLSNDLGVDLIAEWPVWVP